MTAFRIEFDVYVVRVGDRAPQASNDENKKSATTCVRRPSRLDGYDVIFLVWGGPTSSWAGSLQATAKRASKKSGRGLHGTVRTAHEGLRITEADWKIVTDLPQ